MSMTIEQEEWLVNRHADMDMFLSEQKWRSANSVIDTVRKAGYEHEADLMRKSLLRAQSEMLDEEDEKLHKEEIDAEIDGTEDRLRDDSF